MPARLIHWLSAALLTGMAGWGWYMMSIEDEPGAGWYFGIHQSVGLLVALLVGLRIVWRATHRPAARPGAGLGGPAGAGDAGSDVPAAGGDAAQR
ncbi:MAG TPA: cytochrome b/b6 domain-containing protein, partial [Rubrivivax sp.]|nr:cytochrome b/b6 domain-containing protein [Rubrivivax sp.]